MNNNIEQVFAVWSNYIKNISPLVKDELFIDTNNNIKHFLSNNNLNNFTNEFLFENLIEIIRKESFEKKFCNYIDDIYYTILTCMITKYVLNINIMTLFEIVSEKLDYFDSYETEDEKIEFMIQNYYNLKKFESCL